MEKRDRPELGITLEDILRETLLNLETLEADLAAVKRRLCEHLETARGIQLDGEVPEDDV